MTTSHALTNQRTAWTSDNGLWKLDIYDDAAPDNDVLGIVTNTKTGEDTSAFLQYGYDLVGSGLTMLPGYVRAAVETALVSDRAAMQLREMFKPGDTVTTLLRHVSSSGMSRSISVIKDDSDITWTVARFLGEELDSRGGITVGGCGMDMGFHLVYGLSSRLYRSYECTGIKYRDENGNRCPSNTHVNPGDHRDDYGPGVIHTDGYALNQRWL